MTYDPATDLRAALRAELLDGASLGYLAKRHQMTPAVARSLLDDADLRAVLVRALTGGATMHSAARQVGVHLFTAQRLLGLHDPAAPVPADIAAVIVAAFDAHQPPAKIGDRLSVPTDMIARVVAAARPDEYAYRQMCAGVSADALAARAPALPASAIASADLRARQTSAAKFGEGGRTAPRVILRTADGCVTVSTDPDTLAAARHQMAAIAKGRAWTEARVG